MIETDLQYGEKVRMEPGTVIYSKGDRLTNHPIYYIIAGLIRVDIALDDGSAIPVYQHPDSVFGGKFRRGIDFHYPQIALFKNRWKNM